METENKKHKQIVDAARSLFWKHGIKRVSIEEICKDASVSKMTFYKHFANKLDLTRYILDVHFKESMKEYRKIMDSNDPYNERVRQAIELKLKNTEGISQEMIIDLYKNGEPEIVEFMKDWSARSISVFIEDFKTWQASGDIRPEIKPEFILYMMGKMAEIASDANLAKLYSDPAEMILELSSFLFYGLLPAKNRASK